MREEFTQKEEQYEQQLVTLKSRIEQLELENSQLDKNYRHHNCDYSTYELSIDNIDPIKCED